MKNVVIGILLLLPLGLIAQTEQLYPIQSNSALLLNTPNNNRDIAIGNNIIVRTDTLSLPFVDEFSKPSLRPLDAPLGLSMDTQFYNTGSCLINVNFDFYAQNFHTSTAFFYSYDTTNDVLDSVALNPVKIYIYENANCFSGPSDSVEYWLPYYTSTIADFDTITGLKLDSTLAVADTQLSIAPLYFTQVSSTIKWLDNYAYQNTTFPIDPPTIGVATLDGLNEFGLPYNNSVTNAYGEADVLTSKPLDLSGLENDSAVFLSFFAQPQGLGDFPDGSDSLIVQFRNEFRADENDDGWTSVWSISTDELQNNDFKQYYIEVRDTTLIAGPRYFYNGFQFRFKNLGSISGNNDHWHIDYVRLDKDRSLEASDTVIRDVAFVYDLPNYLENYSQLPWRQFEAGADSFIANMDIPLKDNGGVAGIQPGAFPIEILITEDVNGDTIFFNTGSNFAFGPGQIVKNQSFGPSLDFVRPVVDADTVCFNAEMSIAPTDRNVLTVNDTAQGQICFENVMAYDDGSAEKAYGVSGGNPTDVKKFAYEFAVAIPDTLAAIQVHFSNIDEDVSNLVFSFFVWDSIELGNVLPFERLLGSIENQKPDYIDRRNGFATFVFDTAITVTDNFYIGWAQIDDRNLQIGYDLNSTKGRDHMFVFVNNIWNPSSISTPGSVMMRVILDGSYPLATGIQEQVTALPNVSLYPNPTTNLLNWSIDAENTFETYHLNVIDLTGRIVKRVEHVASSGHFSLGELQAGLYFLTVQQTESGLSQTIGFVKQ